MFLFARYRVRTALIQTIATLYDNSQEVGSGSGLLIGDHIVLTNNHLIPPEINYRTLQINARLEFGSKTQLRPL